VRPALDDAAVGHDDDQVGVPDRRQPMRDDDARAVRHEALERLLDEPLRFGVERGRRLVEDQDRRVPENRAGDGDPLALTAGEPHAQVADRRIVACGSASMNWCAFAARAAATTSSCGRSGSPNAMFERTVSLKRNVNCVTTAMCAEALERQVADVVAADRDATLGDVVEPRDEVGERALPAPAHAHERDDLADGDLQVDVAEHRLAGVVGERDVLELDAAADAVEDDGARAVDDLGAAIEEPERALRAREALLDRVVRADELLERLVGQRQRR
jgi:hypothetical protein